MSAGPRVSVVMPCFNHGAFIDEAVESVLAQTLSDVEIIIVDDGSTDPRTVELLADYRRPQTRVIRTANNGPSAARNRAITEAAGEYILPLDADDRIAPRYLEHAVAVLDANPDVGIVYGQADYFGARSGRWRLADYAFPEILLDNLVFNSCVYRRRDWERCGGYNTNMVDGWEDYDFVLSLVELGVKVHRLSEVVYFYRVREGSRDDSLDREAHIRCYEQLFQNHRGLYLENIGYLFRRFYDMRHIASQQVHLEHRVQACEYAIAHLSRVAEARGRQFAQSAAEARALRRQLELPLPKLIKHRLDAARRGNQPAPPPVDRSDYDEWYSAHRRSARELEQLAALAGGPRFVLKIAAGGGDEALRRSLESLIEQVYADWTVIVDRGGGLQDPRIEVGAGDIPSGVYTATLEPGVVLEADALWEAAYAIQRYGADLVYGDHDQVDAAGRHAEPALAPDFSPDTLLACNYVGNFFVAAVELVHAAAAAGPAGAYDALLRATEKASMIYHAPRVLSHHPAEEANPGAADGERAAVERALERRGQAARVETVAGGRARRILPRLDGSPRVSVVIPASDEGAGVESAVVDVMAATGYAEMEVLVAVPEAAVERVRTELSGVECGERALRVVPVAGNWRWAQAANIAVESASGEHVLLFDPRVRMPSGNWVEELLAHSARPEIGAVGVRLDHADGSVCHGGVVVGVGGAFDFAHRGWPAGDAGCCDRLLYTQNLTAVSGACVMIKRFVYRQLGGMDTVYLSHGLHDVDLCLRAHELGFLNLFVAHVGGRFDIDPGLPAQDAVAGVPGPEDLDYFRARYHRFFSAGDPYYNPAFDRRRADFRLVP